MLSQFGSNASDNLGFTGNQGMNPGVMGLLSAVQAYGAANPPQPASRLPLAQPSQAYMISQALGGLGQGYREGVQTRNQAAALPAIQAQGASANLGVMQNLQMYNMWAPLLGQPTISMQDLQKGNFDKPTMTMAQSHAQQQPQAPQMPPQVQPQQPVSSDPNQVPLRQNMAPPPSQMPQTPVPQGISSGGPPQSGQPQPQQQPSVTGPASAQANQPSQPQLLGQSFPYLVRKHFGFPTSPIEDQAFAAGQNPDSPQVKAMIQLKMQTDSGMTIPPGRGFPGANFTPGQGYSAPRQGISDIANQAGGIANAQLPAKEAEARFTSDLMTGAPSSPAPPGAARPSMAPTGSGTVSPVNTPKGTVVPSPMGNQVMGPGSDLIAKQNTASVDTQQKWDSIRPTLEQSQNRLEALSKAFQQVQTGGLTTEKAQIANALRGAGMGGAADKILSAKDTAAAQIALWNGMQDVLTSLKTINTGAGGRILNSEFQAFLEHGFSPDMAPTALHQAITQQLGLMYQMRNMISDYHGVARQQGWRDANQFQSAYLDANPIDNFVGYAEKTVPPFKGMEGAPAPITKTLGGKTYQWVP